MFRRRFAALALALPLVLTGCPEWSAEGTVLAVNKVKGTLTVELSDEAVQTFEASVGAVVRLQPGQRVKFRYNGDKITRLSLI